MNPEHLTAVLQGEAAAVPVPRDAWEVNQARVRRSRRRRATVLTSAAAVATIAVGAVVVDRAQGEEESTQRVAADSAATATPPPEIEFLAGPVQVGHVTISRRQRPVVAYLMHARPDEVVLCTAVVDDDGRVTPRSIGNGCAGRNHADRDDFLFQTNPLEGSGLPVPDCRFGPLGNAILVLTSSRTTSARMLLSDRRSIEMERVPATESWPYGLFRGEVPPRRFLVGVDVAMGSRRLGDALPAGTGVPATGCPSTAG